MMKMANYMRAAVAALTLAIAGMAAAAQDGRSDTAPGGSLAAPAAPVR